VVVASSIDKGAGTVKTGGAKPVADPTTGYAFDDETIGAFHVQPVSITTAVSPGSAFDTTLAAPLEHRTVRLTGN
jgi:hypothetical protein